MPLSTSLSHALVRRAAWMEPVFMRRTYSVSSPITPPGRMFIRTLPPEILFQSSPMLAMTLYQTEFSGAIVAMTIFCARAGTRAAAKITMLTQSFLIALLSFAFRKQIVIMLQQPARAPLRHQVRQPVLGLLFRIDRQRLLEQFLEFSTVPLRLRRLFRQRNVRARALPFREFKGAVEMLPHQLLLLVIAQVHVCRGERDQKLGH